MLKSLTYCAKNNKLILNNSVSPLVKLVIPVIVCSFIKANYSKDNKPTDKPPKPEDDDDKLPDPPTNCCQAGCAKCVWVEYAEKLSKKFKDGGAEARKKILEHVTDENMRAFLLSELRHLEKKNKKE